MHLCDITEDFITEIFCLICTKTCMDDPCRQQKKISDTQNGREPTLDTGPIGWEIGGLGQVLPFLRKEISSLYSNNNYYFWESQKIHIWGPDGSLGRSLVGA